MDSNKSNPIDDAIDKGLISIAKCDVKEAQRQWLLVTELQYTKTQVEGDIFTPFLKLFQRN